MIAGSFVTTTLGRMHYLREPERARKGPKGPDEASCINIRQPLSPYVSRLGRLDTGSFSCAIMRGQTSFKPTVMRLFPVHPSRPPHSSQHPSNVQLSSRITTITMAVQIWVVIDLPHTQAFTLKFFLNFHFWNDIKTSMQIDHFNACKMQLNFSYSSTLF